MRSSVDRVRNIDTLASRTIIFLLSFDEFEPKIFYTFSGPIHTSHIHP